MIPKEEREAELFELEKKKVKALEKIANSLDALAIWFEEIDKQDWSDRVQFYLAEWHKTVQPQELTVEDAVAENTDIVTTEKPGKKKKNG